MRSETSREQAQLSQATIALYSSHAGFSAEQLRAVGVSAVTVRFAMGIEAAEDIIADITQASAKI